MPGLLHKLHKFWEHHHHHHENAVHGSQGENTSSHLKSADSDVQDMHTRPQKSLRDWEEEVLRHNHVEYYSITPGSFTPGSDEEHHFKLVEEAFFNMVSNNHKNHYRIDEVQYVVNPKLVNEFKEKHNEVGGEVILGFHGTREASIKSICKFNFHLSKCKSYTPMGSAIWFSTDPLQALLYVPTDKHCKKLVVGKILLGDSYRGMCRHACDECMHGTHSSGMYDTVIDGHVVMVMDQSLILPCYVVTISEL